MDGGLGMDLVGTQNDMLTWAAGASRFDRMEFLKQYLLTLEEDELRACKLLVTHRKRSYRKAFFNASVPVEAAPVPVPAASEPVDPASAPLKKAKSFWWEPWSEMEIVALDCEMITPKKLEPGQKKRKAKAGTVSVVDYDGKPFTGWDNRKVKHDLGSFLVNTHTLKVNDFREGSLVDGDEMKTVVGELTELLKGKLIVTCSGVKDFECLGLAPTQFDHFDIQWFWKEEVVNRDGVTVEELLGLRRIYHHYFKEDIQAGTHNATTDAAATMKLFREVFIPHCIENELYEKSEKYERFVNFPKL